MKAKDILGFIFLRSLFFIFFWFFDLRMGRIFIAQYHSEVFLETSGEVLSGVVTTWTGSKGQIHYHPSITYRYQVDGKTFVGKRIRYDGHPSFYNQPQAQQIIDAHPKNSEIEVYYNPANPADSILSRGLDTADLGIPFIFGSWTCLFFFLIINLGSQIDWQGKGPPLAGGAKIDEGARTLELPLTFKRRQRTTLTFTNITSVVVEKIRTGRSGYSYAVKLEIIDGMPQILTFMKKQENAESFASWLREKIGIKSEVKI